MSDPGDPASWNRVQRLVAALGALVVVVGGVIAFSPVSAEHPFAAATIECGAALAERLQQNDLRKFCTGAIHSRSNLGLLVAGGGLVGGFVLVSLLGDTNSREQQR